MIKRILALGLVLIMSLSLLACGAETTGKQAKYKSYEEIETAVQAQMETAGQTLSDEFQKTQTKMGDSFDGYVKSLTDIDAWYALCLSESNSLYAMLFEATTAYYHLIADAGIEEYKTWNDAMAD